MDAKDFIGKIIEASNLPGVKNVKMFFNVNANGAVVEVSGNKIEIEIAPNKEAVA